MLALAASLRRDGQVREAIACMERLLGRTGVEALGPTAELAGALASVAGLLGWLGWSQGRLLFGAAQDANAVPEGVTFLSGRAVLNLSWQQEGPAVWSAPWPEEAGAGQMVHSNTALLGAPMRPATFLKLEGLVERTPQGVRGWIWFPRDPARRPQLRAELLDTPDHPSVELGVAQGTASSSSPFAAPWTFEMPAAPDSGPIGVREIGTGQALTGRGCKAPAWRVTGTSARRNAGVAVILSLRSGERLGRESVSQLLGLGADELIVTAEEGGSARALRRMFNGCSSDLQSRMTLIAVPQGIGYGAAWNAAAREAGGADLLIVCTGVHLWPGALPALMQAAPTGTSIPLSDSGDLAGYPDEALAASIMRDEAVEIAAAALRAAPLPIDLGECSARPGGAMFIRRTCFDNAGRFREALLFSAEGTLQEFAARAARAGFRPALAPSAFAWRLQPEREEELLLASIRKHDQALLADLLETGEADSDVQRRVALARRSIDAARLEAALKGQTCVLLVTHDEGGGVERHVQDRAARLRRSGKATLLLRSRRMQPDAVQLELSSLQLSNIAFRLPQEQAQLLAILQEVEVSRIELHHIRYHPELIRKLPQLLEVPYDVVLHDYALICPRVTLVGGNGNYCGEPGLESCEGCAAGYVDTPRVAPAGVAMLRQHSAALLEGADHVWAPSSDVVQRFRRHLPSASYARRSWERVRWPSGPLPTSVQDLVTVCVVGAITEAKGFGVLLACARDAIIGRLKLRFVVVGHTVDDASLLEAGCFVTGPYEEEERAGLIERQRASVGFLPSIWPEPWCYSLTALLAPGLPTACFDIGAQADRVRQAGGMVLPLGAHERHINEHLLKLARSQTRTRIRMSNISSSAGIFSDGC